MRNSITFGLFSTLVWLGSASAHESSTEAPAPQPTTTVQEVELLPEFSTGSLIATVLTDRMGQNKRTHVYSNDSQPAFFYEPALFPQWNDYRNSVASSCVENFDKSELTYAERFQVDRLIDQQERLGSSTANDPLTINELLRRENQNEVMRRGILASPRGGVNITLQSLTEAISKPNNSDSIRAFQSQMFSQVDNAPELLSLNTPLSMSEVDEDERIKIILPIFLDDDTYRSQVVQAVKERVTAEIQKKVSDSSLFVIPYDLVRILIRSGDQNIVAYTSDEQYTNYADPSFSRSKSFALDRKIEVDLDLTCNEHLQVVADMEEGRTDLVSGELYRTGAVFSKQSLFFAASANLIESFKAELFTDESIKIESRSSSGGGGLSLSIPLVGSLGVAGGAVTASLEAQRLVSRDVLDQAVHAAVASATAACTGTTDCFTTMTSLVNSLLVEGIGKGVLVRDETTGQYSVVKNQIEYFTITDSEINGQLDQKFKSTSSSTVTAPAPTPAPATGGAAATPATPGAASSTLNTEVANDLAGNLSANKVPIAISGDLVVISEASIDRLVSISIVSRLPVEGSQRFFFPFLYASLEYRNGEINSVAEEIARLQGEAEEAALRAECEKPLTKSSVVRTGTVTETKTFRSKKPRGWTSPATAIARAGYYIEEYSHVVTSNNRGEAALYRATPHANDVPQGGIPTMYQSVSYRFYCKRGRNGVSSTRSCRASGYVNYSEVPLVCAPYRIDGFGSALP